MRQTIARPLTDRRRLPRFAIDGEATVIFPRLHREVTVLELSLGGALVEPVAREDLEDFAPDAVCAVRILAADRRDTLAVGAVVSRRCADGCVALELRNASARALRVL